MSRAIWPKEVPALTPEQRIVADDFMKFWHEVLPQRYGLVESFNHGYAVRSAPKNFCTTLEIGAGLGEHLSYERLSEEQRRNYVALELRSNMAEGLQKRFPDIQVVVGDCQQRLPFADGSFDRILAVHVLEHLPNLPAAVAEMHRLCAPAGGVFSVVIPCEGGLAYTLARRISAQRIFERRYKQSYDWFISREHLNKPEEILEELSRHFDVLDRSYYPLAVPWIFCNLSLGLTLRPSA
jgi:SAM-dependent methyltransferase